MDRTEEELRAIARKRVEARNGFIIHLVMYLVGNAGIIVIWALTNPRNPWFVWVLLGWGVAVVAHAVTLWIGPGSEGEQRAIEREVGRLRGSQQPR